jgi:hypothetical protein
MCKHCGDGESVHYAYIGSDGRRNAGCAARKWGLMGVHWCGCPGFEEKSP